MKNLKLFYSIVLCSLIAASEAHSLTNYARHDYNDALGLYASPSRFYDPEVGSFISKDPIGISDSVNQYQYARSNPVNYIDLNGLETTYVTLTNGERLPPLNDPTPTEFISFLESIPDNSIQRIEFSGHGNTNMIKIAEYPDGKAMELAANYGSVVLMSPNPRFYFSDVAFINLLLGKMSSGGICDLNGCNTASEFSDPSKDGNRLGAFYTVRSLLSDKADDKNRLALSLHSALSEKGIQVEGLEGASIRNRDIDGNLISTPAWDTEKVVYPGNAHNTLPGVELNKIGGVIIDKAAELVNANISNITGAVFDPLSHQLVFLGDNNPGIVSDINMDYFYTAIKAVYGSSAPPSVTLERAARTISLSWIDSGNGDGNFNNGEEGGFWFMYKPYWVGEDNYIDIEFKMTDTSDDSLHEFTARLSAHIDTSQVQSGRNPMYLQFDSWLVQPPVGISFKSENFPVGPPPLSTYDKTSQESFYEVTLENNSGKSFTKIGFRVISDRVHRKLSGNIDETKLGWVIFQADRILKCLVVGSNPLSGELYNSSTIPVLGFQNMLERKITSNQHAIGRLRFWLSPDEMKLKKFVNPENGKATIMFDSAVVALNTEEFTTSTGLIQDFADHFESNFDLFASVDFAVIDPDDPTGTNTINVKIFNELKEAMKAVALARFFKDNNIPLDMWWLSSWNPPKAYISKSIELISNIQGDFEVHGGVKIEKLNEYIPSIEADSLGELTTTSRPDDLANSDSDIDQQSWSVANGQHDLIAVAASIDADQQVGNVRLAEKDMSFASPGKQHLEFTRYYDSSYVANSHSMGAGWSHTRYIMQFSRPTLHNDGELMFDDQGQLLNLNSTNNFDTRIRSGIIRIIDQETGQYIEFISSLDIENKVDPHGNPFVVVSGLDANERPTFSPGRYRDGSQLTQGHANHYFLTTPKGEVLRFLYDGRLINVRDTYGNEIIYSYDFFTQKLFEIRDQTASGAQIITIYYNNEKVSHIIGPEGERVDYDYHDGVTSEDGIISPEGCLKSATSQRSGAKVTYLYGDNTTSPNYKRIVKKKLFNGKVIIDQSSDLRGRAITSSDLRGNTFNTSYSKDVNTFNKTASVQDTQAPAGQSRREWCMDNDGKLVCFTDEAGSTTSFGYDEGSIYPNVLRLPIHDRSPIRIDRNSFGQPTFITDPDNADAQPFQFIYNSGSNLLDKSFDSLGRLTDFSYNNNKDLNSITRYLNGQPKSVTVNYDNGFVETITNAKNETATFARDEVGRINYIEDDTGVRIDYSYDQFGRLWRIKDLSVSGTTNFDFDGDGSSEAYSNSIIYEYDNFDRIIKIHTPQGYSERIYNSQTGYLEEFIDILGRSTLYEYDTLTGDLDKIKKIISLPGIDLGSGLVTEVITDITIDRFGNLKDIKPHDAGKISYSIDNLGRVNGISEEPITPDPYAVWQESEFTPSEISAGNAERNIDEDNDGVKNEFEYLFGRDPKSGSDSRLITAGETTVGADTYTTITYTKKAGDDFTYKVSASDNLIDWHNPGSMEVTGITLNSDGTETVTLRDLVPMDDSFNQKVFFRVTAIEN